MYKLYFKRSKIMDSINTLPKRISSAKQAQQPQEIQPMPLWLSAILFGVPTALVALGFHWLRPFLEAQGYSPIISFLGALAAPLALLFAGALVGYHVVEGRPLEWEAFSQRMRFPKFRWIDALLGVGLFIMVSAGYALFSSFGDDLIRAGLIPVPAGLPAIVDPLADFTPAALDRMAGGRLLGQWDLVLLFLVTFFFNIVGEELWWRGYILPRQELTHGKWTWLLHGLLWNLFHVFKWWDLIGLLPVTLILSFSAQRLKNNWPVLIAHALLNGISLVIVIAGVIGLL
jgi:membrane protease YdiL (CAAX protease family)